LPAYKLPSDYYKQAAWVAVHPDYTQSRELPYYAQAVRPLVEQCVVCDPDLETSKNMTVIIAPLHVDYPSMRAVVRAIVAAKTSLQAQADLHCDEDEVGSSETVDCQLYTVFSQITAVVLVSPNDQKPNVPDMLPSYITVEKSHPIDSLARHPFAVAVISHCDANAFVPAAMEMEQICIERKGVKSLAYDGKTLVPYTRANVHDIAQALINILLQHRGAKNNTLSSKNSAADLIAKAAYLKKTKNISELVKMSNKEMRMYLGQPSLKPPVQTNEFFHHLSLMVAAFTLLAFGCYARLFMGTVKQESQISVWRRRYRWIAPYLDDIDPSIFHLSKWLQSPDAFHNRWDRNTGRKEASENDLTRNRNGATHQHNKRKKTVKKSKRNSTSG
jgi:hypothetical protein